MCAHWLPVNKCIVKFTVSLEDGDPEDIELLLQEQ